MEKTDTHSDVSSAPTTMPAPPTDGDRWGRLVLQAWRPESAADASPSDVVLVTAVCNELRNGCSTGLGGAVRRWATEQDDVAGVLRELSALRRSVELLGALDPVAVDTLFEQLALAALERFTTMLHVEARTDALTGVGNRRCFDERIERVLAVARRRTHPVTVCFVDLDGLKDVNDRLGHRAGDAQLRQMAEAVRAGVRIEDEVFRVGGDEFAVVMPFCTRAEADAAMSRVARVGAPPFSYGIASYPEDGLTSATLVVAADVAMYRARASRRGPAMVELLSTEVSRPWVTKALVSAMAAVVLVSGAAFARVVTNAGSAPTAPPAQAAGSHDLPFPIAAPVTGPVTSPASSSLPGTAPAAVASGAPVAATATLSATRTLPAATATPAPPAPPATGAPARSAPPASPAGALPVTVPVATAPAPSAPTTPAPSSGVVGSLVGGTVAVVGSTVGGLLGIL